LFIRRKQCFQTLAQCLVTGTGLIEKGLTGDARRQFGGGTKERFLAFLR